MPKPVRRKEGADAVPLRLRTCNDCNLGDHLTHDLNQMRWCDCEDPSHEEEETFFP